MTRKLTLTVALDWPQTAAQSKMFTEAIEAEFKATKEKRFDFPRLGLGIVVLSDTVTGIIAIPRIWRRSLRYLRAARVISNATDPWCYHAEVLELRPGLSPYVQFTLTES